MSREKTRIVPTCAACKEPLGLYYAECLACFGYADEYTLDEYAVALGRPRTPSSEASS